MAQVQQPVMTILPRDGLRGDPGVPVRVGAPPILVPDAPPLGATPMSGWLFAVSAGLFTAATGAGIVTGSPMVHAMGLWAAILVAHFAMSYFIWVDPFPRSRFIAVPLAVTASWLSCAASFLLLSFAPAWMGWTLVAAGLLAFAAGAVPLGAAWVQPLRRPLHRPVEAA